MRPTNCRPKYWRSSNNYATRLKPSVRKPAKRRLGEDYKGSIDFRASAHVKPPLETRPRTVAQFYENTSQCQARARATHGGPLPRPNQKSECPRCGARGGGGLGACLELSLTPRKNEPHAHCQQGEQCAKRRIICCGHGMVLKCKRNRHRASCNSRTRHANAL